MGTTHGKTSVQSRSCGPVKSTAVQSAPSNLSLLGGGLPLALSRDSQPSTSRHSLTDPINTAKHVSFADETTSQSQLSWSGVSGRLSVLSSRLSLISGRLSVFSAASPAGSRRSRSLRSAASRSPTRPWSRVSRKRWSQPTLEEPLRGCKTAWPVSLAEALFLPEFPVGGRSLEACYQRLATLGTGAFGKVYRVRQLDSGEELALKVVSKAQVVREAAAAQLKAEVCIQAACGHHPYVVCSRRRWQSRTRLFVLQEVATGGELRRLVTGHGALHPDLARLYTAQLAIALDFLHHAGVIFRDLKLENVLLDEGMNVKLADFGLAKWLRLGSRTGTLCGTLQYMAPELLDARPYTHAVDWWSLGVLAFVLLTGTYPVSAESDHEKQRLALHGAELQLPCTVPAPARALVARLLVREPRHRLTGALQLGRQAWFMQLDLDTVRNKQISACELYARHYPAGSANVSDGDECRSEDFIDFDASTVDESLASEEILEEFPALPTDAPCQEDELRSRSGTAAAVSTPNRTLDLVERLGLRQPVCGGSAGGSSAARQIRSDNGRCGDSDIAGPELELAACVLSSPDSVVASSGVMSPHRTLVSAVRSCHDGATAAVTREDAFVGLVAPPRRADVDSFDDTSSVEAPQLSLHDAQSDGARCQCDGLKVQPDIEEVIAVGAKLTGGTDCDMIEICQPGPARLLTGPPGITTYRTHVYKQAPENCSGSRQDSLPSMSSRVACNGEQLSTTHPSPHPFVRNHSSTDNAEYTGNKPSFVQVPITPIAIHAKSESRPVESATVQTPPPESAVEGYVEERAGGSARLSQPADWSSKRPGGVNCSQSEEQIEQLWKRPRVRSDTSSSSLEAISASDERMHVSAEIVL